MDEELRLIKAGRTEAAKSVHEEQVAPSFEALDALLEDTVAAYEDAARRTGHYADAGLYSMAALLSFVLAALFLGYDRS